MNYDNLDSVEGYVNVNVSNYADSDTRISSIHVYGSYGDESEEPSSDLDVLVGLSQISEDDLEELKDIFRFDSNVMLDVELDVQVVKQEYVGEYLLRACRMRNYERVYDVHSKEHVDIAEFK